MTCDLFLEYPVFTHRLAIMPGVVHDSNFKIITVKELHPTFAAEIGNVNFQDLSEEQFGEIVQALSKVGFSLVVPLFVACF